METRSEKVDLMAKIQYFINISREKTVFTVFFYVYLTISTNEIMFVNLFLYKVFCMQYLFFVYKLVYNNIRYKFYLEFIGG